ncbi:MAG: phenylacetate-CoA oxygenase/reductase subunit PaaK [Burkholderiales bacterium]|nr:phenylacetate-CoA oxygenase/reductase subunit PaaK [Burkholderiales bacterium]
MAQHFHPLTVADVSRETADCLLVSFDVPAEWRDAFSYRAGQYLTLRAEVGDRELRRSYSLCSAPHEGRWQVAIKRVEGGQFSQWAHALLRAGDVIDVLPPDGHFIYTPSVEAAARHVLLLAAGSGITPTFAILKTLLEGETASRVTLVYGNRRVKDIIFKEALEDLRDRFLTRFQLLHTLSGEVQEAPIANGRLDAAKVRELFGELLDPTQFDAVYVCGPGEMIADCVDACVAAGVPAERVHKEVFGVRQTSADAGAAAIADNGERASVAVIADGIERVLQVGYRGEPILDAALAAGIDVPYACKAGVCCTCRAQVLEGEVRMDANYTLEAHEVNRGFVLTCQAHPVSDRVRLSYDAR